MVTTARSILRAALLWTLRNLIDPSPSSTWTWGIVHLMGQREIRGQYTDPSLPTFQVRELLPDGSFDESTVGRSALYQAREVEETTVRRLVLSASARDGWALCVDFTPSPVLHAFCSKCGEGWPAHRRRAAEARTVETTRAEIAKAAGMTLTSVRLWDEDGESWRGDGPLRHIDVFDESGTRRDLTREEWEWEAARAAGATLRVHPEARGEDAEEERRLGHLAKRLADDPEAVAEALVVAEEDGRLERLDDEAEERLAQADTEEG